MKEKTDRRERVPVGGKQPARRDHASALITGYIAISLLLWWLFQHFVMAPAAEGREPDPLRRIQGQSEESRRS